MSLSPSLCPPTVYRHHPHRLPHFPRLGSLCFANSWEIIASAVSLATLRTTCHGRNGADLCDCLKDTMKKAEDAEEEADELLQALFAPNQTSKNKAPGIESSAER